MKNFLFISLMSLVFFSTAGVAQKKNICSNVRWRSVLTPVCGWTHRGKPILWSHRDCGEIEGYAVAPSEIKRGYPGMLSNPKCEFGYKPS